MSEEANCDPELEKDKKIYDLTSCLQRLQAEFDNFRKRQSKENQDFLKYANRNMIEKLLPIVDNFELALKNTEDHKEFVKGMKMIHCQLLDILTNEGLVKIDADGKQFDPKFHEALLSEKSDKDGEVLEVMQNGFMLGERVLRHSKVKVGKKEK